MSTFNSITVAGAVPDLSILLLGSYCIDSPASRFIPQALPVGTPKATRTVDLGAVAVKWGLDFVINFDTR